MPAKCPWCETNTHDDKDEILVCQRVFLTPAEAWNVVAENLPDKDDIHVFCNPRENALIGCDWSRESIKEMLGKSKRIELVARDGVARSMKHGICVKDAEDRIWFVETDEPSLKAFEEIYCNVGMENGTGN